MYVRLGGGVGALAVGGGIGIVGGGPAERMLPGRGPFVTSGAGGAPRADVAPTTEVDRTRPRTAKARMPTKSAIAP